MAAKRTKMIYTGIGAACVAAAAALLIWNNSDSFKQNRTAATIDGTDFSVSDLEYYYKSNQIYYYNLYSSYGTAFGYDGSKSDGEQWYNEEENKTYADYFRESALDNLKQTAVLCTAAEKANYTLTEEGQKLVDERMEQIDLICARYGMTRSQYFSSQYGVSEKVFLRNLTNDVLASEYAEHYAESLTYTDEELEAYYKEHADELDSFSYGLFTISGTASSTTDEDGNTVEPTEEEKTQAMADAKAKADKAAAAIRAAGNKASAFQTAAADHVEDAAATLHEDVTGSSLPSAATEWLTDSSRKAGDVTVLESSESYQVVLFQKRARSEEPTADIRHILIMADTTGSEETDASGNKVPTQEALDAAKAKAESLLQEWKSGEQTAESFGVLAEANSDDPGSNTNGGQYTDVAQGQMFADFNDWIFADGRTAGDTGLVENPQSGQQGWHIIYFEGESDPSWKVTSISALQSNDQSEWTEELTEAAELTEADGMQYVGDKNTAAATATPEPSSESSEAADDTAE